MMERIRTLCIKHREILVYLIVGVMTTVVAWTAKFLWNFIFYAGTAHPTPVQTTILTIVEYCLPMITACACVKGAEATVRRCLGLG